MKSTRRSEVFGILHGHMNSGFGSFVSNFGYSARYNAADFARVLAARLECQPQNDVGDGLYERFTATNAILNQFIKMGGRATPQLDKALETYKAILADIVDMVFFSISQGHIISTTQYFVVYVHMVGVQLFSTYVLSTNIQPI